MHVKLPKHPPPLSSSLCGMAAAKLPAIDHLVHIKKEKREEKKIEVIDYKKALLLLLGE
jgi:hypothetical protein